MPTGKKPDWDQANPRRARRGWVPELSERELTVLRLLAEQGAIPLDQLSRLSGLKSPLLKAQVRRLEEEGCLASHSFAVDRYVWLWATRLGGRCVGMNGLKRPPVSTNLNHRRAINEARLELSEEFPEGRWIPESDILCGKASRPEAVPDGLFDLAGDRWAIEAELSRKTRHVVTSRVERFLADYDKVVYFCAPHLLSNVKSALADFPAERVEVREAKVPSWLRTPPAREFKKGYKVSARQLELLRLISEEGTIAVDQLALLDNCELEALRAELAAMERYGLVEQGFGYAETAWVWCTSPGSRASGTGISLLKPLGPSRLPRRRALMSVRLALTGGRRQGRWVTRRMLGPDRAKGTPREMAVLERRGKRIAVAVSLDGVFRRPRLAPLFARLSREHDAVWWYCSPASRDAVRRIVAEEGWENVDVRFLPTER